MPTIGRPQGRPGHPFRSLPGLRAAAGWPVGVKASACRSNSLRCRPCRASKMRMIAASTTRPLSNTRMRSWSHTVDRLCATTIAVRPTSRRSIVASASDSESRSDVASSSIRIGAAFQNLLRARQR